jgi:putative hydrolase of the HAD superfamily
MIKAVIFDLDGTLIDRRRAFLTLCEYLIDKYAKIYPFSITKEELVQAMIDIDANGYGGLRNFIPKLQSYWKLPLTTEEFIRERNDNFGKFTVTLPGAHEVLSELRAEYKLGMITNGFSSVQREKLEVAGITEYFDDILVSGEVSYEKPEPEIFLMSCSRLGITPEEAVFVGDYYPNDIAGALAVGIKPIWIQDEPLSFDTISDSFVCEPAKAGTVFEPEAPMKNYDGLRISSILELPGLLKQQ